MCPEEVRLSNARSTDEDAIARTFERCEFGCEAIPTDFHL